jgi:5-methylcytosine-specific restriction endonuclease McrA
MICQKCGKPAIDRHHVFFHNRKGKNTAQAIKVFVNNELNLQDLCRPCHINHGGKDNREQFMLHQVELQGRDEMLKWLDTAPDKIQNSYYDSIVLLANGFEDE